MKSSERFLTFMCAQTNTNKRRKIWKDHILLSKYRLQKHFEIPSELHGLQIYLVVLVHPFIHLQKLSRARMIEKYENEQPNHIERVRYIVVCPYYWCLSKVLWRNTWIITNEKVKETHSFLSDGCCMRYIMLARTPVVMRHIIAIE